MEEQEEVIIYTLVSSEFPNDVRYIGKTYDTKKRLKWHLAATKKKDFSYKINWIRKELSKGNKIIIEKIDTVSIEDWGFWEEFYIQLFKGWGFNLTNIAQGGNTGDYKDKEGAIYRMTKKALERIKDKEFTEEEVKTHIENKGIKKERIQQYKKDLEVLYLDKLTGEIIGEAKTTKILGEALGISYKKIQECLKGEASGSYKGVKKVRHSYKGYVFLYKKDYDSTKDYKVVYKRKRDY